MPNLARDLGKIKHLVTFIFSMSNYTAILAYGCKFLIFNEDPSIISLKFDCRWETAFEIDDNPKSYYFFIRFFIFITKP